MEASSSRCSDVTAIAIGTLVDFRYLLQPLLDISTSHILMKGSQLNPSLINKLLIHIGRYIHLEECLLFFTYNYNINNIKSIKLTHKNLA